MNLRLMGAFGACLLFSTSFSAQDDDQIIAYRLFVGTAAGAHESHNWGENWFSIAAKLPGTIHSFACPGPEAFAAGSQGLFYSEKYGEAWVHLESWTGGEALAIAVSSYFAIDPVMFVGTTQGLFVSRDGGDHFGPVGKAVVTGAARDIAWPGAALFVTTDSGLFRSRDGGSTWIAVGEGLPKIPLLSAAASRYFEHDPVAFVGSDGEGLYRSRDGGETFEKLRFPGRRVHDLYWWRASLFAGTEAGPFVSTDAGESWELLAEDLEGVPVYTIHVPVPDSPSGSDILLGTDRGVFKSSNGGISWRSMDRGLSRTRVFGFGNFPISSGRSDRAPEEVKPQIRFLALGEAGLGLAGLLWVWLRSIPITSRFDIEAWALGILAAAVFSVVNLGLYGYSRRLGRPAGIHAFLENGLFPVFRGVGGFELALLALLAGFGEEIFFRGALQQETGIWVASLIFGVLHGPSKDLWLLGLWAAVMGALLGFLYESTGNLVVPAVAHAVYDGVALVYVRNKFRRIDDEVRENSGLGE